MSVFDWEREEHTYEEILKHFFDGVSETKYRFNKDIYKNGLERAIYSMIDSMSSEEVNVMNLEELDKLGITGNKLVKLWELCKCNEEYFKKTVGYITGTYLSKAFSAEEVLANLSLKFPYQFVPEDRSFETFQKLMIRNHSGEMTDDEFEQIIFDIRTSLVKKYNDYVLSHPHENRDILPEVFMGFRDYEKVL